jgi:hypothetical protein
MCDEQQQLEVSGHVLVFATTQWCQLERYEVGLTGRRTG